MFECRAHRCVAFVLAILVACAEHLPTSAIGATADIAAGSTLSAIPAVVAVTVRPFRMMIIRIRVIRMGIALLLMITFLLSFSGW